MIVITSVCLALGTARAAPSVAVDLSRLDSQAASDAALRKNLVAIYTAAGGGWQSSPAQTGP